MFCANATPNIRLPREPALTFRGLRPASSRHVQWRANNMTPPHLPHHPDPHPHPFTSPHGPHAPHAPAVAGCGGWAGLGWPGLGQGWARLARPGPAYASLAGLGWSGLVWVGLQGVLGYACSEAARRVLRGRKVLQTVTDGPLEGARAPSPEGPAQRSLRDTPGTQSAGKHQQTSIQDPM